MEVQTIPEAVPLDEAIPSVKRHPLITFISRIWRVALAFFGCLAVIGVFSFVSLDRLGQFETSDERLWKDTRIPQYRKAMSEGNWKKTYINDKPGVSLAILSGAALPSVPDPTKQEMAGKVQGKYVYRFFKADKTERINEGLRFPIVVFTAAMLGVISWLIFLWTRSPAITFFAVLFIAFNPVLLGISRILNPDAILWSSSLAALLCYLIVLERKQWRFVILAGLFFGWALLSKYTANLLTPFFVILLFLSVTLRDDLKDGAARILRLKLAQFITLTLIGYALFALLCPAVFGDAKLFWKGTLLSRGLTPIIKPLGLFFVLLIIDAMFIRGRLTAIASRYLRISRFALMRVAGAILFCLLVAHLVNAWTGASFVPLNDLREVTEMRGLSKTVQVESLAFPLADGDNEVTAFIKKVMVQSASAVFALPSVVLIILTVGTLFLAIRGRVNNLEVFVLFALTLPWIFFVGGLMANVFVNVRYGILLQPFLSLLAAVLLVEMIGFTRKRWRMAVFPIAILIGGAFQWQAFASIAPHYLNYQNIFLPKEFSMADSWGYGMYEAAQWLNAQPDAKKMRVWADRQSFCRFFNGKCIRSSTIDLSITSPDYFVFTRRNIAKGDPFRWKDASLSIHDAAYYYSDDVLARPDWELWIGNRPLNYVKIIAMVDEKADLENSFSHENLLEGFVPENTSDEVQQSED